MTNRSSEDKRFSLRRWSQRKAAARAAPHADAEPGDHPHAAIHSASAASVAAAPIEERSGPRSVDVRAPASPLEAPARDAAPAQPAASSPAPALPSLDSLSIESDFTPFMQAGVDDSLKRGALKKLFSDPRFNVMDGLDVYIDDYSKPDPLDPAIARTLAHARYIFNPPPTRVTAEGYVEDIPEEELQAAARNAESEAAGEPDVAAQDAAAALPGVQPQDDAVSSITRQQDAVVATLAHQQDDAMPTSKAKPEVA
ncbi:MAG TPA: DUF3306 domain-containing protein [Casimicrobiaceae bacterium]|nr:DUF3306 domain-containing protein [Casimicrobiaceae bacterium]